MFFTALSLAILLGFPLVGLIAHTARADIGSIPDWIEAVATVAAFAAAVSAARYAASAFTLEREREAQRLDAERRAQASLVAAWPTRFLPYVENMRDGTWRTVAGVSGAEAAIRNASDIPVTSVHVDFYVVHTLGDARTEPDIELLGGEDLAYLPPDAEPQPIRWSSGGRRHLLAGVPSIGEPDDYYPDEPPYDPARLLLDIWFRDAAGVVWHRDRVGRLEEAESV